MNVMETRTHRDAYFVHAASLFRQLAAATRHGLPLQEVTYILAQDPQSGAGARNTLQLLHAALVGGASLGSALEKLPQLFPRATVQWVQLAQERGMLAPTLDALADDSEREVLGRGDLRIALLWPAMLLVMVGVLLAMLAIFVVPAFDSAFTGMGADLPALTRTTFDVIAAVADYVVFWVPMLGFLVFAYYKRVLPAFLLRRVDAMLQGNWLVRQVQMTRFTARMWGLLQATGCDADLQAAALAHLGATNKVTQWRAVGDHLHAAVSAGRPLSEALAAESLLPARAALYVRLGEKMQDLAAPLAQLAHDADYAHRLAIARCERGAILAIYVLLGIVIGNIVIATYLPIFKLGQII